jgi:hypothetical protein
MSLLPAQSDEYWLDYQCEFLVLIFEVLQKKGRLDMEEERKQAIICKLETMATLLRSSQ